jgi:3'-phosphoadenosine 5'-phosphosulfate sulfotransferase (PAPS reductase)/FAD synthetase
MPMPTELDNGEVITVLRLLSCSLWLQEEFIGKEITRIREICGPKGRVIGAVSGGVDSTVAAKLMHEAIGDRCVPRSFHQLCLTRVSDSTPSWWTMACFV